MLKEGSLRSSYHVEDASISSSVAARGAFFARRIPSVAALYRSTSSAPQTGLRNGVCSGASRVDYATCAAHTQKTKAWMMNAG